MFCQKFKAAFDSSGLSRRQLTELTGISAASISQYFSGRNVPSLASRQKLARALRVPEDYFEDDLEGIAVKEHGPATMTATEAAARLGISYKMVTRGLRDKIFPWGYALPPQDGGGKWKYVIIRAKFEADVNAEVTA